MDEIDKINDKMFKKAIGSPQRAINFLRKVLPYFRNPGYKPGTIKKNAFEK